MAEFIPVKYCKYKACGARLKNEWTAKRHAKSHHLRIAGCRYCGTLFTHGREDTIPRHERTCKRTLNVKKGVNPLLKTTRIGPYTLLEKIPESQRAAFLAEAELLGITIPSGFGKRIIWPPRLVQWGEVPRNASASSTSDDNSGDANDTADEEQELEQEDADAQPVAGPSRLPIPAVAEMTPPSNSKEQELEREDADTQPVAGPSRLSIPTVEEMTPLSNSKEQDLGREDPDTQPVAGPSRLPIPAVAETTPSLNSKTRRPKRKATQLDDDDDDYIPDRSLKLKSRKTRKRARLPTVEPSENDDELEEVSVSSWVEAYHEARGKDVPEDNFSESVSESDTNSDSCEESSNVGSSGSSSAFESETTEEEAEDDESESSDTPSTPTSTLSHSSFFDPETPADDEALYVAQEALEAAQEFTVGPEAWEMASWAEIDGMIWRDLGRCVDPDDFDFVTAEDGTSVLVLNFPARV
ncbi:hypothetical protein BDN72DRAFT_881868 [Pluteus cervinus]|uniref:Uncharacterized protein n=1 Tax=Pluteus cervinus TaxID=181527 RepID=A0ACD3AG87_9AGAR|nr:hypothetical protein BDN72DRAFT_881868 [Pluteus cervinus]